MPVQVRIGRTLRELHRRAVLHLVSAAAQMTNVPH